MARQSDRPHAGVDLQAAVKELAGVVVEAFDFDFVGIDVVGNVAIFLGEVGSPVPRRIAAQNTSAALETIARAVVRPMLDGATHDTGDGYRTAAVRAREPIFDAPLLSPEWPLHEKPFDGYPHLVIANAESDGGPELVRRVMTELGGREVLVRDGFGAAIDVVGWVSYDELHESGACKGCRVLDDPHDPRPRAPEAIAMAGLYVYGFGKVARANDHRGRAGAWLRIASPSVPADRDDFVAIAGASAPFEELSVRFEDAKHIGPFDY